MIRRAYSILKKNAPLNITTTAWGKMKDVLDKDNTRHAFKFSAQGGGCNGYNYIIEPKSLNDKLSEKVEINSKITMEVCSKSLLHILGTNIDWEKTIMGETFTFSNPNAAGTCGCGTSFSV